MIVVYEIQQKYGLECKEDKKRKFEGKDESEKGLPRSPSKLFGI